MNASKTTSTASPKTEPQALAPADVPHSSPLKVAAPASAPKTAAPKTGVKSATKPATTAKKAPSTQKAAAPKAAQPVAPKAPSDKAVSSKVKAVKEKKVKVVRDSFTIPKTEFAQLADMKKRATELGINIKKSELIRAGLQLLSGSPDTAFKKALNSVPTIKTGRPSKD